jgi:hypothetical protein
MQTLNKIQHPFTIKVLKKLKIERTQINIIKAIYDKSIANILLKGENWDKTLSPLSFNTVLENYLPEQQNWRKK